MQKAKGTCWMLVRPGGQLAPYYAGMFRRTAIAALVDNLSHLENQTWNALRRRGWRVVRVRMTEI